MKRQKQYRKEGREVEGRKTGRSNIGKGDRKEGKKELWEGGRSKEREE